MSSPVLQLRLVLETDDLDAALAFYRDALVLPEDGHTGGGGRRSGGPAHADAVELAERAPRGARRDAGDRVPGARRLRRRLGLGLVEPQHQLVDDHPAPRGEDSLGRDHAEALAFENPA